MSKYSINNIITTLSSALNVSSGPVTPLPPELIIVGGTLRSGLSAKKIAANIISRQSDAGAPSGPLPDGKDSVAEKMEQIRIEELINSLLTEAVVDVVIPPGIPVQGVGSGIGVVTFVGMTVKNAKGFGIIR